MARFPTDIIKKDAGGKHPIFGPMKHILFVLAAFGFCFGALAQQRRVLVWNDEFNYKGLPDTTKWVYEEGFVRNQEPQYYTIKRPANCRVDSGMLIIEARKEAFAGKDNEQPAAADYTSASITTEGKASWKYGRIEIRAKVPPGNGSWPAIWLLGESHKAVGWPACGEVDIMEYLGRDPGKVYGTVHYADSLGKITHEGKSPVVGDPADGFHVYALQWYPDRLEFYYDSLKYFVFDLGKSNQGKDKENVYRQKFYLLLNLALGHPGSWAGPIDDTKLPMRYCIDYARVYQYKEVPALPSPDSTIRVMRRVADWQLNQWKAGKMKYPAWDWVNGAAYTGIYAMGEVSKDTAYFHALREIGNSLQWNTGPRRRMADDYCIAQTYAQLANRYKDPNMIRLFKGQADSIAAAPHTESLEMTGDITSREWSWCDALFMGPTSLAYLATATKQVKYLDLADSLWWKTTRYLYSPNDSLYFRDSHYFDRKEANGQPMFWARGNGWVLAGLARVLSNMPDNYPDREKFIALYKEMAAKIAAIQQPDGTWHASLLDPDSFPNEEMSGTGFYCYALAWGVNHGLLQRSKYELVIRKAWAAMCEAVQSDGRLGYVQQIGEKPGATDASTTEAYGTGAFLLAGSEVYHLSVRAPKQKGGAN